MYQLGKSWSAWCLDCALCGTFRMLSFLKVSISEQTWFMASLTLHYSITTVGDNDKAAPEFDHSRQDESHARALKEETAHVHSGWRSRMRSSTLKISISIAVAPRSLIQDCIQMHLNDAKTDINSVMPCTKFLKFNSIFWQWISDTMQTSQWLEGSYQGKT